MCAKRRALAFSHTIWCAWRVCVIERRRFAWRRLDQLAARHNFRRLLLLSGETMFHERCRHERSDGWMDIDDCVTVSRVCVRASWSRAKWLHGWTCTAVTVFVCVSVRQETATQASKQGKSTRIERLASTNMGLRPLLMLRLSDCVCERARDAMSVERRNTPQASRQRRLLTRWRGDLLDRRETLGV